MSEAPLVQAIVGRLRNAGYSDVATPFRVATVSFEFTAALRGRDGRSLDLVLLVDTTTGEFGDRDLAKVRQRIEALSRALDITRSRYVLTVILAGAALAGDVDVLSDTCRVLNVEAVPLDEQGRPANEAAELLLDDRIRILLPLQLPPNVAGENAGESSAIEALLAALPEDMDVDLMTAVIEASEAGEDAVAQATADALNVVLALESPE